MADVVYKFFIGKGAIPPEKKWKRLKRAYQYIDKLGKFEQDPIQKAKLKYELVGGELYDKFKKEPSAYVNTCALRMSYALNYSGTPITKPRPETNTFLGNDKKIYVLGSQDIRDFLHVKQIYKALYDPKSMNSKKENEDFYNNELLQLDKNGIVFMRIDGWGQSAFGHTTLWDGTKKRFLDDSNYLLDERSDVIVRKFHFWEVE